MPCIFKFKAESKFRRPSEPQAQALEAIRETAESGIVVLPCGAGKTAVFLQAALEAGNRVLFLNFEKQGVTQVRDAILEHTTVGERQLCAYSSECKTDPNTLLCYMVTTYSMFSSSGNRSDSTTRVRNFVLHTPWDLVVLDECHHACAETYKPLVEHLVRSARRVLGFTGTLCRSEVSAAHHSPEERQLANSQEFKFIGRVLHSRTCAELEAAGLIAKVRRVELAVHFTPLFSDASGLVAGQQKQYLQALNPQKLNALWALVNLHRSMGHVGMIFTNHLLPAKSVKALLGPRWEILSGGNAHGTEGVHTAQANSELVKKFNDGQLDGLIATPVGESALDVHNPNFRFAVVVDAHSGQAPASQKLGRLSRTPRVKRNEGEDDASFRKRLLSEQKVATYYEIITHDTEEQTAASARDVQFEHDGYTKRSMKYEELFKNVERVGVLESQAPLFSAEAQLRLLVECVGYQDLGFTETEGRAKAAEVLEPHQKKVKSLEHKAHTAKSALFRERHKQQLQRTRAQLPKRKAEAQLAKRDVIASAAMSEAAAKVLRKLQVDPELLARANLVLPPDPLEATEDLSEED